MIELPVEGAGHALGSSATAPPLPLSMMQGVAKLRPRIPALGGGPVRPTSAFPPAHFGRKCAGSFQSLQPSQGPCSSDALHRKMSTL